MAVTNAEETFRRLLILWLLLFGGGVLVLAATLWSPFGLQLVTDNPLIVFTWVGQLLLFACSLYLLNGIRDHEILSLALVIFKFVSGTVMIALTLHFAAPASRIPGIAGGLLDYVMGAATVVLWLRAKRSRVVRMPLVFDIEPIIEEEPDNMPLTLLRRSLGIWSTLALITGIVLLIGAWRGTNTTSIPFFEIVGGNAVATYITLAAVGMLATENPRRRPQAFDIVVLVSLFAGIALLLLVIRVPMDATTHSLFIIGGIVHLSMVGLTLFLNNRALETERKSKFFGGWLHQVYDKFAEVLIKGNLELVTSRELADITDHMLSTVKSPRVESLKLPLLVIEFWPLTRLQPPMSRLGRLEREHYLTQVFQNGRGIFRDLIRFKQLVLLVYYSDERVHSEIGFVPFEKRTKFETAKQNDQLPTGEITYPPALEAHEIETDICIIGSGAAGAVLAARLAEAGKRVVILEEGPYLKRDQILQDERDMPIRSYRDGGLQLTLDFDMYILQGRVVGGSTFVNNGVCFDLPDSVLTNWNALGTNIDPRDFAAATRRIRADIPTLKLEDHLDLVEKGSRLFVEGCEKLGLNHQWFEVSMKDCIGCGFCTSGCKYEKKMSVDLTFIPRALKAGAILVSDCKADRVITDGTRARSVTCARSDGSSLTVKAKQIVVAGGAVHSSLLLHRSNIRKNVGTRLSFNLGSWVFGEFPTPVDSFDGIEMCAYYENSKYLLETIALGPGAMASSMPGWFRDHFDKMQRFRYFSVVGTLIGSEPTGKVNLSPLPVVKDLMSPVDFTLPISDLRKLKAGVRQSARILLAAGASRVIPATFQPLEIVHPGQLDEIETSVIEPDDIAFGSGHPQGGNPMSDNPQIGAIDSHFRVHGMENLFVCDASVFPTSIQVNPQISIMSMADYASQIILELGNSSS